MNINKFFRNYFIRLKYKNFNKKNFFKKKSKEIVLIEFNAFHNFHVLSSFFVNLIAQKTNSKIVAFSNINLVVRPNKYSILEKIKFYVSNTLGLNFFGIYKSFGCAEIIFPNISDKNIEFAKDIFNKNYNLIKDEYDLMNFSIKGVKFGDLILDSYVKYFKNYDIDFSSKRFQNYFIDFISLYSYWETYFSTNKINSLIVAHDFYAYGLITRISIKNNIDTYVQASSRLLKIDEKNKTSNVQFIHLKKIFSNFSEIEKIKCKKLAEKFLDYKFSGKTGVIINEPATVQSAYEKFKIENKILKKSDKIKVLIATHELFDASFCFGDNFFPSFKQWLYELGKLSEITDYDWYIKDHPVSKGMKMEMTQKITNRLTDEITNKFKKIKKISSNSSHLQLINEGMDYVLTVYGTIVYEYAFFSKTAIVATQNHLFKNFNFFIQPKDKSDYIHILKNLSKKSKINFNKNEIYEFYFMQYLFNWHNNIFDKYEDFLIDHKYDEYCSVKFYDYFMKNMDNEKILEFSKDFERYYKSKDFFMNCFHKNLTIQDFILKIEKKINKY